MADRRSAEEKREAAAIRRRWITLGEILAVVAVAISALTFWNSYRERTTTEADRAAEKAREVAAQAKQASLNQRITLRATPADRGKRLTLAPLDRDQAIQNISITFPSTLEAEAVDSIIQPRIEARWLEDAARAARKNHETGSADRRLPIAVTTRFVSGGETYTDTTLYDVGYRLDSSLLGGTDVELRGLSQIERAQASTAQARLDAIWKSRS
jgi:hypothetical protein